MNLFHLSSSCLLQASRPSFLLDPSSSLCKQYPETDCRELSRVLFYRLQRAAETMRKVYKLSRLDKPIAVVPWVLNPVVHGRYLADGIHPSEEAENSETESQNTKIKIIAITSPAVRRKDTEQRCYDYFSRFHLRFRFISFLVTDQRSYNLCLYKDTVSLKFVMVKEISKKFICSLQRRKQVENEIRFHKRIQGRGSSATELENKSAHPCMLNWCLNLFSIYETHSVLYFVTEYCVLGTLKDFIKAKRARMNADLLRFFLRELIEAVDFLHSIHDVIHRYLAPENIGISSTGHLKVMNLSQAITTSAGQISANREAPLSGIGYLPPECFGLGEQKAQTFAIDFWSLGCILYFLLARRAPFGTLETTSRSVLLSRIEKLATSDARKPSLPMRWRVKKEQARMLKNMCHGLLESCPMKRHSSLELKLSPFFGASLLDRKKEDNLFEIPPLLIKPPYLPHARLKPSYSKSFVNNSYQRSRLEFEDLETQDQIRYTYFGDAVKSFGSTEGEAG